MERVSVYIPAYNVEQYLEPCVKAIRRQDYPVEEIIVVDDGSSDGTLALAKKLGVHVVKHLQNSGLACVRNTAVKTAKTEFVASLDADCVPIRSWLRLLMEEITRSPSIAGAAGPLLEHNQTKYPDLWRVTHMLQSWGDAPIINPGHLCGNNNVFRRSVLEEVGFYNEGPQYRTNNEDYYITRQMTGRGYTLIYNSDAVVWHLRKDTCHSIFRTYWRWFYLHRPRPDSIGGFIRKTRKNMELMQGFVIDDIMDGKIRLIPMELLFVLYQARFDLRYLLLGEEP
ncbi:glycosyltransferase [Candidatus Hydrogenedentota bacterium]